MRRAFLAPAGLGLGMALFADPAGEEVQLHLAGEVPDGVFPNTCNAA